MRSLKELEPRLNSFQEQIGYKFNNVQLLIEALTHSSYANEQGLSFSNERLEFLGDAVLELVVSEMLFKEKTDHGEGELTRLRSRLVCKESLHSWASHVGLSRFVLKGKSLGGEVTLSMVADAAEAFFCAVFLDGGYEAAYKLITSYIAFVAEEVCTEGRDPKTELQELLQAEGIGVPYYREIERKGPNHALRFLVEVTLGEATLASAWGATMKEAEFAAARLALIKQKSNKDTSLSTAPAKKNSTTH